MVSGFVALDLARAVYPSDLAPGLAREGYRLEADFDRVHHDRPAFLKDLTAALAGRNMLFDRFWAKDWDLFFLVVTDTDRLLHFMYREYLEGGPIRNYFLDFFHQVDRLVGRVAEETERRSSPESPVALVLLSDHGFCPTNGEFHLNRWLAANGFQREPGPEARVLALDPTRLYLNRPPRFPEGRVRPSEADRLAGELTAALAREPAVAGVLEGKNLYNGPQAFRSPDLVVQPSPGFEFKAKFNAGPMYTPSPLMGTHSHQDAFYLVRNFHEHPAPPAIAAIQDLGAWIFSYFSL
jgi:predicted AlkP superfamily phosphohydrolase/phosphomutase